MAFDLDDEEYEATRKLYKVDDINDGDIQVGEYVRSNLGSIGKVTRIEDGRFLYENKELICFITSVVKHSKNIIDLLEVGDYVNGYKILQKTKIKNGKILACILTDNNVSNWRTISNETLKNIVTHEQFNTIMYEVEE